MIASVGAVRAAEDFVSIPGLGDAQGVATATSRWFLGIPYGTPPVGDQRWRPSSLHSGWAPSILDATQYGANCAQNGTNFNPIISPVSEDCLFLNVYAPLSSAPRPADGFPVWLWLHGGGFVWGGGNETRLNGTYNIDRSEGVIIIVTINYRLGPFGFLGNDLLRDRDPSGSTGNYGLQDQRLAMAWVRSHIAAFGGNPASLFIVGESAGAGSVSVHLSAQYVDLCKGEVCSALQRELQATFSLISILSCLRMQAIVGSILTSWHGERRVCGLGGQGHVCDERCV
jgi:carboxylesterase type B